MRFRESLGLLEKSPVDFIKISFSWTFYTLPKFWPKKWGGRWKKKGQSIYSRHEHCFWDVLNTGTGRLTRKSFPQSQGLSQVTEQTKLFKFCCKKGWSHGLENSFSYSNALSSDPFYSPSQFTLPQISFSIFCSRTYIHRNNPFTFFLSPPSCSLSLPTTWSHLS